MVYAKACLGRSASVLAYLSRYTHRIALSDHRLLGADGERVGLRYRDYRDKGLRKVLWLAGTELVRRVLLHVLPKAFMRIRHYGMLANRCRAQRLSEAREAIARASDSPPPAPPEAPHNATQPKHSACPRCHATPMVTQCFRAPRRLEGG